MENKTIIDSSNAITCDIAEYKGLCVAQNKRPTIDCGNRTIFIQQMLLDHRAGHDILTHFSSHLAELSGQRNYSLYRHQRNTFLS